MYSSICKFLVGFRPSVLDIKTNYKRKDSPKLIDQNGLTLYLPDYIAAIRCSTLACNRYISARFETRYKELFTFTEHFVFALLLNLQKKKNETITPRHIIPLLKKKETTYQQFSRKTDISL